MGSNWHKFDHIGIIVKDIDKAMEFYKKVFGFQLPKKGPYKKIYEYGRGAKYCLISSKGGGTEETFIEFLAPVVDEESKMIVDFLEADGVVREVCIAVDDIEEWYNKVKSSGYTPVSGYSGEPLVEKKYVEMPSRSKCFYLLPSETGMKFWIEILERPGQPYRKL